MEVVWADGHVNKFSERLAATGGRKIVYIPQRFLNGICELNAPAGRRNLDDFTRDALRQRPSLADAFDKLETTKTDYDRNVRETLDRLFSHFDALVQARERLSQAGDEEGVQAEIKRVDEEIASLRDASSMTPKQKTEYDRLSARMAELSGQAETLRHDSDAIASAEDASSRAARRLEAAVEELKLSIKHPEMKKAVDDATAELRGLADKVDGIFKKVTAARDAASKSVSATTEAVVAEMKPLSECVAGQKALEELAKKKNAEAQRLLLVQRLELMRESAATAVNREVDLLVDSWRTLQTAYEDTCAVLANESDALGDIGFSASMVFDDHDFNRVFVAAKVKTQTLKDCLGEAGVFEYVFDPAKHEKVIGKVARGMVGGNVECMKGVEQRQAIESLMANRLMIDYQIEYRGDGIEAMSPGKRALVVLKILLELSSDEWPILLDQPDDDLDSRSVYRELVSYFKSKKRERQIILVTHNPNLVVGSDADSVIVANQSGQEVGRDNAAARFEYVSGALECAFVDDSAAGILNQQGIREHVCDVLEGGRDAFRERERKYRLR